MSGIGAVGCGEKMSQIERVEREKEREGSRITFSTQETTQGWGMKSVRLHRVSVCYKALYSSGAELLNEKSWNRTTGTVKDNNI